MLFRSIPQTLSQQDDILLGTNKLKNWVESSVNNTYPYPGSDFNMSYITAAIRNIDASSNQDIALANKAVNLVTESSTEAQDLFQQYKSL